MSTALLVICCRFECIYKFYMTYVFCRKAMLLFNTVTWGKGTGTYLGGGASRRAPHSTRNYLVCLARAKNSYWWRLRHEITLPITGTSKCHVTLYADPAKAQHIGTAEESFSVAAAAAWGRCMCSLSAFARPWPIDSQQTSASHALFWYYNPPNE